MQFLWFWDVRKPVLWLNIQERMCHEIGFEWLQMQWDQGRGRSRRSMFIWTSKRKRGKGRAVYLHQWPQGITLPLSCLLFINPLSSKHSALQLFPVRDKVGRMWFRKPGKWEFQTGWCHVIRDSGQESKLPCSFYVWLNTLCVCLCVCVCLRSRRLCLSPKTLFPFYG